MMHLQRLTRAAGYLRGRDTETRCRRPGLALWPPRLSVHASAVHGFDGVCYGWVSEGLALTAAIHRGVVVNLPFFVVKEFVYARS